MIPAVPTTSRTRGPRGLPASGPPDRHQEVIIAKTTYPQCACKSDRSLCKGMFVLKPMMESLRWRYWREKNDARQQEWNHVFARRSESFIRACGGSGLRGKGGLFDFRQLDVCSFRRAGAYSAARAAGSCRDGTASAGIPRPGKCQLPTAPPAGSENRKDPVPRLVLKAKTVAAAEPQ